MNRRGGAGFFFEPAHFGRLAIFKTLNSFRQGTPFYKFENASESF
jgi:hypothetical protein